MFCLEKRRLDRSQKLCSNIWRAIRVSWDVSYCYGFTGKNLTQGSFPYKSRRSEVLGIRVLTNLFLGDTIEPIAEVIPEITLT